MVEKSKEKRANEQAKAQNLFARWRKEETLYSEDEKKKEKQENNKKRINSVIHLKLLTYGKLVVFYFSLKI